MGRIQHSLCASAQPCRVYTPTQRERLIIVATLDSEELQPHICQSWPATQHQTMETFLDVMHH